MPNIRPMTQADIPGLLPIEQASFPEDPYDAESFTHWLNEGAGYVAEENNKPIGYQLHRPVKSRPGFNFVQSLAVHPDHRRTGIAAALMDIIKQQGNVTLDVDAKNDPALNFYKKHGFRREATLSQDGHQSHHMSWQKAATIGIPDRAVYGDLSKLQAGQLVNWIVQRHQARRAGLHQDIRFGTPETGLYSWAARKELPQPGKKILAVQQPLHDFGYKDFEGEIPEGYGAGTVRKHDEGRILLTRVEPGKIHFTMAHKRYPERFVLVKPTSGTGVGAKPANWLLMNTTPTGTLPFKKEHYKSVPAEKIEPLLENLQEGSSVQAKIDGALTLTQLLKDKIETLSYRTSKVHGGPLPHTERIYHGIPQVDVPKQYRGSVLQGELYAQSHGRDPVAPQALGGLLNSSVGKSLDTQRANNIRLKQMIFDVQQVGKKKISFNDTPHAERMQHVRNILQSITGPDAEQVRATVHVPEEAKTPEEALALYRSIAAGRHPATEEGIIIHPPMGRPIKSKILDEHDVYVRGFFPGKGKWQDAGAGGFVYSHKPKGPIVGEVGTGLTDDMRREFFTNPDVYVGRKARVRTTGKLPSGALFQPSLIAMHEG